MDLPTLRGFLQEVEILIKGDVPSASLADSRVRIEDGSLKLVALVAQLLAADMRTDLVKLTSLAIWTPSNPSAPRSSSNGSCAHAAHPRACTPSPPRTCAHSIRITNTTQFQHGSENAWVTIEKYLTGKVVNAGGKQDPNVHLVLADTGETIKIDATEQQLAAEKENQLYKDVTLRVQAEQHLRTKSSAIFASFSSHPRPTSPTSRPWPLSGKKDAKPGRTSSPPLVGSRP